MIEMPYTFVYWRNLEYSTMIRSSQWRILFNNSWKQNGSWTATQLTAHQLSKQDEQDMQIHNS